MKNLVTFIEDNAIGGDKKILVPVTGPGGGMIFGADGNPRFLPINAGFTAFSNLPAAALAIGKDDLLLTLGTGTEVVARSTKGGANIKTQASSPADNDNAMLIPVAANSMYAPITAFAQPRLRTCVKLTQITELVFGAGLDENITSPIGSATAGDGAQFIFDPANELTLLSGAAVANFVAAMKVAGVDTYVNTGIPVIAGRYYELEIRYGADRIPTFYIDGVLVATGAAAGTADAVIGSVVGVQINAVSPAGQKDFDCLFVEVSRQVG